MDNDALARYAQALKGAIQICNADKAALRTWAESAPGTVGIGDESTPD